MRSLSMLSSKAKPLLQNVTFGGHQNRMNAYFMALLVFIILAGFGSFLRPNLQADVSKYNKAITIAECPDLPVLGEPQNFSYPPEGQRPTGLHLAFVGDSVTRYQVLGLMHYLHTGRWIDNSIQVENMAAEFTFESWPQFYSYASSYFGDAVRCDCFRLPVSQNIHYFDNWYYRDDCRNNTIYHFAKFGSIQMHGHWSPGDVSSWSVQPYNTSREPEPPLWEGDAAFVVSRHIAQLVPKPDYLIINQGLWDTHDLRSHDDFKLITAALNETGIKGIWKTTTKRMDEDSLIPAPHDEIACSVFEYCLDLSWTAGVNASGYWDNLHFNSDVNTVFNQQLLDMLRGLGNPYSAN